MIEHALEYASCGWYVLPLWWISNDRCACGSSCDAAGKHPIALLAPNGLKNASATPDVLRGWWQQYPHANIGIATGPGSGLAIIDVDSRHGGELSMDELEDKLGRQLEAPTVRTGGGGYHLYYSYPAGADIRSRSGALGSGIDIKATGGYVVAPPSIHISGQYYEWDIDLGDRVLEDFPSDVLELATSPRAQVTADDSGMIPAGDRNNRLFMTGCAMRQHGVSYESIEHVLLDENAARCVPPVSTAEVKRIAQSCAQYSPVDPMLLSPIRVKELWESSDVAPTNEYCVSIREYAGESPPESEANDFWISALMPKAAPIVIAGPPKSAKSLLTLDAGIAMALGEERFLGQPCTRARVLFLPLEDPRRTTQRRIWQLCAGRGIRPEELEGWLAVDSEFGFYFDQSKYVGALRRAIDKFHPDVVIVDSLARAFSGDENNKEALTKALGPWQDIVRATGVTLAAIHHFRKSTVDSEGNPLPLGLRLRGSGDLFAFVRQVVGVTAMGPKYPRCSQVETSGNYETQVEPFAFRPEIVDAPHEDWPTDARRLEALGPIKTLAPLNLDPRETMIHETLAAEPMSQRRLIEKLNESGHTIAAKTLSAILQRMGAEQVGGGRSAVWRLRSN